MVSFANFRYLDPAAKYLATDLLRHANRSSKTFQSFASTWFAFNGWMECITEASTDAAMVDDIARDDRLSASFADILNDDEFKEIVASFSTMWPVFSVRDIRKKLGRAVLWELNHHELRETALAAGVKHQPAHWKGHTEPTWEGIIRAIYQVRCNLFHGAKSPSNGRDRELIEQSAKILRYFVRRSHCFDWDD